jgi:LacI family transcriptional regulator
MLRVGVHLGGLLVDLDLEFARGVLRYARWQGRWHLSRGTDLLPVLQTNELENWQGDGLLTVTPTLPQVEQLVRRGTAVVSLSDWVDPGYPRVIRDTGAIGALGAHHLRDQALDQFVLVVQAYEPHPEQEAGFRRVLGEGGHDCRTVRMETYHLDRTNSVEEATEMLRSVRPPLGIMAAKDQVAGHFAEACAHLGFHVPNDVAILASRNISLICEAVTPPLSSVQEDAERQGREAAAMLDRLMAGSLGPEREIRIAPRGLLERRSTNRLRVSDEDVEAALQYIRQHADTFIDVSDVLRVVRVSRATLDQRFRRLVGRTVHAEIRRVHVERAQQLLRETDWPIARIARACGYHETSRLHEAFRRETGGHPLPYRRQHHQQAGPTHPRP